MSTKKYTNVNVREIHARLLDELRLPNKTALARELGVSLQNLKNREDRGVNKLNDVELLCNSMGLKAEWILFGKIRDESGGIIYDQDRSDQAKPSADPYHPDATREPVQDYSDPVSQAFMNDWLQLSDVIKMRVWTLVKEELEKQTGKAG